MKIITKKLLTAISIFVLTAYQTNIAEVKLPKLISDGMVLQRDIPVKIWGWASPGENVKIDFRGEKYSCTADEQGKWMIGLAEMKAGGPFDMEITGTNKIVLKNIFIGEVWICSGQSNMQTPMSRLKDLYSDEIASSENSYIRYFTVPQQYDFNKQLDDVAGGKWETPNPNSVLSFAAIPYFFGRNIHEKYNVPVGIINASVGGTPIESWMSEDVLKEFPSPMEILNKYKDSNYINGIIAGDKKRNDDWYAELMNKDLGYSGSINWYSPLLNTADWPTMTIPSFWDEEGLENINGAVWFRKVFEVPASMAGKQARLNLGTIVDSDSVFVNGKFVGTTSYQYPPRVYQIPSGVLKEGKNIIVVRIVNNIGRGGFIKEKPYNVVVDDQTIDLKGEWNYKVGAVMKPLFGPTFIHYGPAGLFNGMIAPCMNFAIKGILWYQGESNTSRAAEYQKMFPVMINDWRKKWDLGTLPFIYAQLPNFMKAISEPSESQWAELREAQLKTLFLENTGMNVNIDVGEWNDIHPLRKKNVADRLFLLARKIAYGECHVVASGPIYESMETDGNKIILSFDHVGSGLTSKDGKELKHFAIAGADKKFVWAQAVIEDDKVIVWNDEIKNPVAVRYAWADNPEAVNFYNKEDLPASPFRTDNK